LCESGKEYLNASLCKFVIYFLQHSETFDVSYVFLPLTIAELSTLKQVRFFGPPCISYRHQSSTTLAARCAVYTALEAHGICVFNLYLRFYRRAVAVSNAN